MKAADPALAAGTAMYELAKRLFPICRSITGDGTRRTLALLQKEIPLVLHEVPSGTRCFDWTVPPEWNIRDAFVLDSKGRKIIDFQKSNLHVVGYSTPVDKTVSLEELQEHLHSLPSQPDAVPYATSYYKENWGFCLTHKQRKALRRGDYKVRIDSTLSPGNLTYGELILPGETQDEIFLSTYNCHPSLANNELSGPVVTTELTKWLLRLPRRRYTYRIVFIPETIGSLVYLSRHLDHLKKRVIAGFNVTCVGDDRAYSYLPSRAGNTLADRAALHILKGKKKLKRYSYLDRGSDERQYCSPGADLPVATVMRSKYCEYPEYHTSKDDLKLISPSGLWGGFTALQECLETLELNETLKVTTIGEPQLGKRGLYPTVGVKGQYGPMRDMMNLLAYCDGSSDLLTVAETIGVRMKDLAPLVGKLKEAGLLAVVG